MPPDTQVSFVLHCLPSKGSSHQFVTIYEVFKVVLRESNENNVLQTVAAMQKGKVIHLTTKLAVDASKLSLHHSLPMADSIILATAQLFDATIWTQDSDFKNISGVNYFSKK